MMRERSPKSLMSSHIHLVTQPGTDPLGILIKKVHSPFANWVNGFAATMKMGAVLYAAVILLLPVIV